MRKFAKANGKIWGMVKKKVFFGHTPPKNGFAFAGVFQKADFFRISIDFCEVKKAKQSNLLFSVEKKLIGAKASAKAVRRQTVFAKANAILRRQIEGKSKANDSLLRFLGKYQKKL